jgi:hypothetical protein
MHHAVSETTRLRDPDQRAPTTYPDDVFVNPGWFLKLIIIGLAVMTLLGAAACGSASGSDSSGANVQNARGSAGDVGSEAKRDDDGQEDRDDAVDDDGREGDGGSSSEEDAQDDDDRDEGDEYDDDDVGDDED